MKLARKDLKNTGLGLRSRISEKAIALAIAMSLIWLLIFGIIGAMIVIQGRHDDSHAGRAIIKEHAPEK